MPKRARSSASEHVVPGEILAIASSQLAPGDGTFVWIDGNLRASVTGRKLTGSSSSSMSVEKQRQAASTLPSVGDTVLCRVTRISPRLANVELIHVNGVELRESIPGLIRREEVRPIDMEPVEVYRSFRPGDIVRARVVSLGDARAYYLSTSASEHGVVLARSAEGAVMRPISWCEMCAITSLER